MTLKLQILLNSQPHSMMQIIEHWEVKLRFTDPTTLEPGQSGPFKMAAGILGNLNVDVDEIRYVKFHLNSN